MGEAAQDLCRPGSIVLKYPVDLGEVSLSHSFAQVPAGKILEMKCGALAPLRALVPAQLSRVELP